MEQEKKPIVWLSYEGGNSSSALQYTLKQGGCDCTSFTTNGDLTTSLEKVKDVPKSRPALIITDSMQVEEKAREANVPVIIQEITPSADYKKLLPKVYEIVPKPEQGTQTGMNR